MNIGGLDMRFDTYMLASIPAGLLNVGLNYWALIEAGAITLAGISVYSLIPASGFFLMGIVPTYLLLRYRLVAPVGWTGLLTTYAIVDLHSFHPFVGFYVLPPVTLLALGMVLVFGSFEYVLRDSVSALSHEPLV